MDRINFFAETRKIGNSLGVLIPSDIIKSQEINVHDMLECSIEKPLMLKIDMSDYDNRWMMSFFSRPELKKFHPSDISSYLFSCGVIKLESPEILNQIPESLLNSIKSIQTALNDGREAAKILQKKINGIIKDFDKKDKSQIISDAEQVKTFHGGLTNIDIEEVACYLEIYHSVTTKKDKNVAEVIIKKYGFRNIEKIKMNYMTNFYSWLPLGA